MDRWYKHYNAVEADFPYKPTPISCLLTSVAGFVCNVTPYLAFASVMDHSERSGQVVEALQRNLHLLSLQNRPHFVFTDFGSWLCRKCDSAACPC
jgi:hypothetical protein